RSQFDEARPPSLNDGLTLTSHDELLNGTNSVRLSATTGLSGANVDGVASAVGRHDIGERIAVPLWIELHAIADGGAVLGGVDEDSGNGARRDVDNIVDGAATVGIPRQVTGEEAEALLASHRSWRDAGVQAKQIGNWASVCRGAAGTDWR